MKKTLLAIFCALPFLVLAQSNYKAGSVTTSNGNVLPGYINYREWTQNPKIVEFRTNQSDITPRVYAPSELKGFIINDMESYVTFTGKISMNHTLFPDLSTGVDSSTSQAAFLFKQLIKGQYVNLYSYRDSLKTRYFVQEQQGQIVELLYQNYFSDETRRQTKTLKSYTGYLIYLAGKYRNNDAGLISSIEHSDYNSKIVNLIYKLNGSNIAAGTSYNSSVGVRYYIGAAYSQDKFTFHIPNTGDAVLNKSVPALNFGFDILPNKNIQKFFVRADLTLSYVGINYQKDFDAYTIVKGVPYYTGNFSYVYKTNLLSAAIAPQIGWNFYNTDNFKFYVDAGVAVTMMYYGDQKLERTKQGDANATLLTAYNFGSPRIGFPLQIGAVFNKRYEVYASYQHYGSFKSGNDNNYNLSFNTIALGIHWLLY